MAIANVTLNNTFDEWRTTTNQLIVQSNEILTISSNAYSTANLVTYAYDTSNLAFNKANTANYYAYLVDANTSASFGHSNTIYSYANSIFDVANAAFEVANNSVVATYAFDTANAAFESSNISFDTANAAFGSSNISFDTANAAFEVANNSVVATYAFDTANAAFESSNISFDTANAAFGSSNISFDTANAAFEVANSAGGGLILYDDNTDSNTYYLPLSNTATGEWTSGAVSNTKLYFVPSTGTLNATIFNSLSDENEKNNISSITNAIETVNQLRGVEFNWKDNDEKSAGVIAQELEKVLPHLVNTNKHGTASVNYSGIIAYLIESIKELNDKIEKLR